VTTDLLKLNLSKENVDEIQQEIARIYEAFRKGTTHESLLKRREELTRVRRELLAWLATRTGKS
jgi:hypothetical protein